jgi:hypothetical protein
MFALLRFWRPSEIAGVGLRLTVPVRLGLGLDRGHVVLLLLQAHGFLAGGG